MKNTKKPLKAHLSCLDLFAGRKKAFSLIEMLLTLIIISLLVSAFVPVVTKKLKSSDITVGSFGAAVTSGECDQFSSEHHSCIMCTTSACSLCSSQMDLAAGQYVDPAVSCDPKECSDFGDDCIGCNKKGCTTCKTATTIGYFRDPENKCVEEKCSDKFGANCSACNKDVCTTYSCPSGYGFNSTTHECKKCDAGYYSLGGMSECKKCETGKISSAGASSCTECSVASHKIANSTQTACEDKNCGSGYYIDGVTCKPCADGTYKSGTNQNTSCTPCPNTCGACNNTTGKCTSCALSGYTLSSSGTCTLSCNPQTVTLSGTTTQVTRFNMGDDPQCSKEALAALSGVTFVPVGTKCSDNLCCWYGATANASTCSDQSEGIYSGCNRTVCKWDAAEKICASIGAGWKLPDTSAYMANWYPTNSTAATGLMLCNNLSGSTKASRCFNSTSCKGAYGNYCYPHCVWANSKYQNKCIYNGNWSSYNNAASYAFGVRCVKE